MSHFRPLIAAAALAAGLAAAPTQAQTLNASSWVPLTHPLVVGMLKPWGEEVAKATDGRVKLNILPKGVANAPGHFDAIRDGLADITFIVHGYTPGRFVLTKAAELPFLGDNATDMSVAYQRIYDRFLADKDEHKGVVVLGVFTHGPGQIFNTQRAITKLSDLDGLKIRVGGGVVNDVAKALDVTSLLKPAPESFELLNSGVADGVFFPKESIKSFKLDSLVKHATFVPGGFYNTSFALIMNPAKFNSLKKEDQETLRKLSGEHYARIAGRGWDAADEAGVQAMKAADIKITAASPGLMREIRSKTDKIEQAWYEEAKAKGVDGAAVMKAFREEIKKLEKKS